MNEYQKMLAQAKRESLEIAFLAGFTALNQDCFPDPVQQYRFDEKRRFKFDFAWLDPYMVAVEIEGGTWTGGRHVTGSGYKRDCEKYNLAVLKDWVVLRLTGEMVKDELPDHMAQLFTVLQQRRGINQLWMGMEKAHMQLCAMDSLTPTQKRELLWLDGWLSYIWNVK